jgi:hypothetical protein
MYFITKENLNLHGNFLWDKLHFRVLSKALRSRSKKTGHQVFGTLNMYVIFVSFGFDIIKDLTVVQCRKRPVAQEPSEKFYMSRRGKAVVNI